MSLNAIKRAIKSAGRDKLVADISEDPDAFEVQLQEPWINSEYQETIWVYGKHLFAEGSTVKDMLEDLDMWMSGIEQEAA
jgi:hypothetical protein